MTIPLIVLAFVLIGCGHSSQPDEMIIKRVVVKDEAELRRYCGDDLISEPLGCARGGAIAVPKSGTCTIYLLEPRGFDDHRRLETQGHEVEHCFKGAKHT